MIMNSKPTVQFFFGLHIILTREATLSSNILNAVRKFARVSKFRSLHETKKLTQNEVYRFFTTWPNLFSEKGNIIQCNCRFIAVACSLCRWLLLLESSL